MGARERRPRSDSACSTRISGMRKQYHFWPGPQGMDAWDVDRLISLSCDLPVGEVPLSSLREVDTTYWSNDGGGELTVRRIVDHMRLVQDADPTYPIILGVDGRIMDGMHRVARALLAGAQEIRAVRFVAQPEPDFRNCIPEELPY
jgi:hypothetical protein